MDEDFSLFCGDGVCIDPMGDACGCYFFWMDATQRFGCRSTWLCLVNSWLAGGVSSRVFMTTFELVTLYWLTACAVTTLALCRWFAISEDHELDD
jgi:hypothetical protein